MKLKLQKAISQFKVRDRKRFYMNKSQVKFNSSTHEPAYLQESRSMTNETSAKESEMPLLFTFNCFVRATWKPISRF